MNWNEKFCKLMEMELFLHYARAKEILAEERKKEAEKK